MLQVILPGDTGRADVPLRPEEMDAAAHFVRNQGYSPEHFGLEPVGHSNYEAWPVPGAQILPEPGGVHELVRESIPDANADPSTEPSVELPVELPERLPAELSVEPAKPESTLAVGAEPVPEPEPASAAKQSSDAQAKLRAIVWKSFPKPRS